MDIIDIIYCRIRPLLPADVMCSMLLRGLSDAEVPQQICESLITNEQMWLFHLHSHHFFINYYS